MSITDRIWKGLRYIIKGVPVKHVTAQVVCLSPDSRLAGRKLLVTGGGRGLGYAMAEKFVREGAQVVITGRNEEVLKNASERIGCRYLVSDIKEQRGFDELIMRAADILGGLDSLVNNAGISLHEGSILDVTPEGFDSQVAVNLRGAYFLPVTDVALRLLRPAFVENVWVILNLLHLYHISGISRESQAVWD